MKKLLLSLAACATLGISTHTSASDHTVTLGYAQSQLPTDLGNIHLKGVNLKYRYEWDNPISVITSLTFTGRSLSLSEGNKAIEGSRTDVKFRNLSLAAGPAYRFNEFVSVYVLAGMNFFKENDTVKHYNSDAENEPDHYQLKTTSFLYGAGVQINPAANMTIDMGYEGTQKKVGDEGTLRLNGFNVGVGYRF